MVSAIKVSQTRAGIAQPDPAAVLELPSCLHSGTIVTNSDMQHFIVAISLNCNESRRVLHRNAVANCVLHQRLQDQIGNQGIAYLRLPQCAASADPKTLP